MHCLYTIIFMFCAGSNVAYGMDANITDIPDQSIVLTTQDNNQGEKFNMRFVQAAVTIQNMIDDLGDQEGSSVPIHNISMRILRLMEQSFLEFSHNGLEALQQIINNIELIDIMEMLKAANYLDIHNTDKSYFIDMLITAFVSRIRTQAQSYIEDLPSFQAVIDLVTSSGMGEDVIARISDRLFADIHTNILPIALNRTPTVVPAVPGHIANIEYIVISPDGNYIATVGEDRRVCIRNAATGESRVIYPITYGNITHLEYTPDGRALLLSFGDDDEDNVDNENSIIKINLIDHTITNAPIDEDLVPFFAQEPRGKRIAFATQDGSIQIGTMSYSDEDNKFTVQPDFDDREPEGQEQVVVYITLAWSPDGSKIIGVDREGVWRIWSADNYRILRQGAFLVGISKIIWNSTGTYAAVLTNSATIIILDVQGGRTIALPYPGIGGMTWVSDTTLAYAHQGVIKIWDCVNQKILDRSIKIPSMGSYITSICSHNDDMYIGNSNGTVYKYSYGSDSLVWRMPGMPSAFPFAMSKNAQHYFSATGKAIAVYDADTHECIYIFEEKQLDEDNKPCNALAASNDGTILYALFGKKTICIYNVEGKEKIRQFTTEKIINTIAATFGVCNLIVGQGNGNVTGFSAHNDNPLWSVSLSSIRGIRSAYSASNAPRACIIDGNGKLFIINTDNGAIEYTHPQPAISGVITDDGLYTIIIQQDDHLVVVPKDSTETRRIETNFDLSTALIAPLFNRYIVVIASDMAYTLYSIQLGDLVQQINRKFNGGDLNTITAAYKGIIGISSHREVNVIEPISNAVEKFLQQNKQDFELKELMGIYLITVHIGHVSGTLFAQEPYISFSASIQQLLKELIALQQPRGATSTLKRKAAEILTNKSKRQRTQEPMAQEPSELVDNDVPRSPAREQSPTVEGFSEDVVMQPAPIADISAEDLRNYERQQAENEMDIDSTDIEYPFLESVGEQIAPRQDQRLQ